MMSIILVCVLLFLGGGSVGLVGGANVGLYQGPTYTMDATKAYQWTPAYPQSCSCSQNGVASKDCSLFQCQCSCDVTAGKCDYGCCCDPDCSSAQIARFSTMNSCAAPSYTQNSMQMCYSSVELYAVNPRTPLGGQPTAESAVASALCITQYNYAIEGHYFTDFSAQSSKVFQQSTGQKLYSYGDTAFVSSTIDGNYDKNDSIAAFYSSDSGTTLYPNKAGFFSLPAADFSGECNDINFVKFEQPITNRSCSRTLMMSNSSIFADQCTRDFSVSQYVSTLYIAKVASTRASAGTAAVGDVVVVTINSVLYEEQMTGKRTDITTKFSARSCATKSYASKSAYTKNNNTASGCVFSKLTPIDYAGGWCANMVKSITYTVSHTGDAASTITAVTADILLVDIPQRADYKAGESFVQTFSVLFNGAVDSSITTSNTNGNQVTRQRSGNPGYLMGKPILFGQLQPAVSSNPYGTIVELTSGLQIPSSLGSDYMGAPIIATAGAPPATFGVGSCPALGMSIGYLTVGFGYDVATGCNMTLTRPQLAALCCKGSSSCTTVYQSANEYYAHSSSGLPFFLNATAGYVGMFGNADPLDMSQWLQMSIRNTYSSGVRKWDPKTGVCTGMPTGLSYKFLVSSAGETAFPQKKIVAAEVEVLTQDWISNVPTNDVITPQSFPLTVTVSFINKQASSTGYKPPAPPVLFKVPADVFYPFFVSPASRSAGVEGAVVLAPIVCALLLALSFRWS